MNVDLAALTVRMLATAAIVVAASLAAERAGAFIGAMVATLPVSVGPAYIFLALDHGPDFVARSALASLLGLPSTPAFVCAYALAVGREAEAAPFRLRAALSLLVGIGVGLAGWAGAIGIMSAVRLDVAGALLVATVGALAGIAATTPFRRLTMPPVPPVRVVHLAIRAVLVAALVGGVTIVGSALGPTAAGFAVILPVVLLSLIVILQPRAGGAATASVMSHGLVGMLIYPAAFAVIHLGAVPLGPGFALAAALALCVAWNGSLVLARWALKRRLVA